MINLSVCQDSRFPLAMGRVKICSWTCYSSTFHCLLPFLFQFSWVHCHDITSEKMDVFIIFTDYQVRVILQSIIIILLFLSRLPYFNCNDHAYINLYISLNNVHIYNKKSPKMTNIILSAKIGLCLNINELSRSVFCAWSHW